MAMERTIGKAAEQAGVGVETIRFYERRGLIKRPLRPRNGGYRLYTDDVIERIRFIRQAQELGFSLREITDLLSLRADPTADCRDVRARAVRKREDVERKIEQLHHMRDALDELIATCPGGGALRACTIIDALTQRSVGKTGPHAAPTSEWRKQSLNQPRTAKGPNVKTANFKIDGMHCEGCAQTIKSLVATVPGVRAADVSFKDGQACILYDPHSTTEAQLARTIERGGFRAHAVGR